jgi:hypothetical protein
MKRGKIPSIVVTLLFIFVSFYLAANAYADPPSEKRHPKHEYKEGELLVKFRPGTRGMEKSNAHARAGGKTLKEFPGLGIHRVKLREGQSVEDAISLYAKNPNVAYAEPNYLIEFDALPNDPQFGELWNLHNVGQKGGLPDADIDAPEAWDITAGSPDVVVAVIDTGIDYTHEDLAQNIWVNEAEYRGLPQVDDDGNGYVDDIYGIDTFDDDSDPMDGHFHGTHVAGTIGAVGENGTGVTGVNWAVTLLACKFMGGGAYGYTSGAIECLEYVRSLRDTGVNIIATNNSWGHYWFSQALRDTINAQRDILFLAGAGNDDSNNDRTPFYPAGYVLPNVVSVAASDGHDIRADFSNFGRRSVHLGAPGVNILSTWPDNGYRILSGTSMAAPHAAGVAALIKAADSSRDWVAVRNLLLSGGDSLSSMDETITGRRLNALGSVNCLGNRVFSVLRIPEDPQPGVPETVSALSIECDTAMGPLTVAVSDGSFIALSDDGTGADMAAGDGIFTGTWLPRASGTHALTFASPIGEETVASPPLMIVDTSVAPPARVLNEGASSGRTGAFYRQDFSITGGIPPLSWTIHSGALPKGLSLNGLTGEISGTPPETGIFPFTLQVADGAGMFDRLDWKILLNSEIRDGWPQELESRDGSDIFSLPASFSPIFADLESDGRDEILVADVNTLYVLNAEGLVGKVELPGRVSAPAAADLDGDGDLEILVAVSWRSLDPPIHAFHHDLTPVEGFPAGGYPTKNGSPGFCAAPVVSDLDGDGSHEILAACSPNNIYDVNNENIVLVLVDGQGETIAGWPRIFHWTHIPFYPTQPAVGDLGGDGEKEIVFLSRSGIVHILRRDGAELDAWRFAPAPGDVADPLLADVDGDGELEVITSHVDTPAVKRHSVAVFDRTGTMLGGWPKTYTLIPSPSQPSVADMDGDGLPEIVYHYIRTHPGESGTEALRHDGSSLPGWPLRPRPTPFRYSYLGVGDINADGAPDLLLIYEYPGKLVALSADGTVLPGYPKYTTPNMRLRTSPAVGDLDNDRRLDIAVKSEDGFLYVWETTEKADGLLLEWPMTRYEAGNSGARPALPWPKYPFIVTESLPSAHVGTAYTGTLVARGGAPPYVWSIPGGSLPGGLALDGSTGVISGMTTTQGFSSFTMQARDANGRTAEKKLAISSVDNINSSPRASARGPYWGTPSAPVFFSGGGSYDPDGDNITYLWDFGDGYTSAETNPSHTYAETGTYAVTLTVLDTAGAGDMDKTSVIITESRGRNRPPLADAGPDTSGEVRQELRFDGSRSYDSDGRIVRYRWDFGDRKAKSGKHWKHKAKNGDGVTVEHEYKRPGTYTVTLTVTDDRGATAQDQATVTIRDFK